MLGIKQRSLPLSIITWSTHDLAFDIYFLKKLELAIGISKCKCKRGQNLC
jgi:hypothetical protein